ENAEKGCCKNKLFHHRTNSLQMTENALAGHVLPRRRFHPILQRMVKIDSWKADRPDKLFVIFSTAAIADDRYATRPP
ncbi:hypothetical protein AB9F41_38175, partial [Rhizobium leguminosarum]|uniref:hypothetical protein n=1 Tax=Rhizobium leguminosarum TaxID=384 RepID=UPI003F9723DD